MYGRDLIEKHIVTALLFSENYVLHLVRLAVRKPFLLFYIIIQKYMCTVYIKTLKLHISWLIVSIIDVFGVSFF